MNAKRTISLAELLKMNMDYVEVKCNTPKGRKEVSLCDVKIGDKVLIEYGYFTEVVA